MAPTAGRSGVTDPTGLRRWAGCVFASFSLKRWRSRRSFDLALFTKASPACSIGYLRSTSDVPLIYLRSTSVSRTEVHRRYYGGTTEVLRRYPVCPVGTARMRPKTANGPEGWRKPWKHRPDLTALMLCGGGLHRGLLRPAATPPSDLVGAAVHCSRGPTDRRTKPQPAGGACVKWIPP